MKTILQKEDPALRKVSSLVPVSEITSTDIQNQISEMQDVLATQRDGIALAAPQIGIQKRIFVISGKLLKSADPESSKDGENLVFINPVLTKRSREKIEMEEGCLSVRWLYGITKRSTRVTITAYNEKGVKVTRGAKGLLAQIFQHEVDHLDGILFIDGAQKVWEMTPEEIAEIQKANNS